MPESETVHLEGGRGGAAAQRSWIVLNGEAIFEIADPIAGTTKELVDHDSVMHIRNDASLEAIHALQELELLQVTYSSRCSGQ